jgi:hypothetical protein
LHAESAVGSHELRERTVRLCERANQATVERIKTAIALDDDDVVTASDAAVVVIVAYEVFGIARGQLAVFLLDRGENEVRHVTVIGEGFGKADVQRGARFRREHVKLHVELSSVSGDAIVDHR